MKNKNLYIGLGVLAVAGIGFYMWKKKQGESSEKETAGASEEKASATGRFGRFSPSRFSPSKVAPIGNVGVGTVGGTVGGGISSSSRPIVSIRKAESGKYLCTYWKDGYLVEEYCPTAPTN